MAAVVVSEEARARCRSIVVDLDGGGWWLCSECGEAREHERGVRGAGLW